MSNQRYKIFKIQRDPEGKFSESWKKSCIDTDMGCAAPLVALKLQKDPSGKC